MRPVGILLTVCLCWSVPCVGAAEDPDLRLISAVRDRDAQAASALIGTRVDVNAAAPDGATALHWAAHWNSLDLADRLLRAGARADAVNDYGVAPLMLAATNGSAPLIDRLVKAGADPNRALPTGETVLMRAAHTGSAAVVARLVEAGAVVDAVETTMGQTALMWAVAEGHADAAQALLDGGASLRARSRGGFTPLLFAVREGRTALARLLLDRGAGVKDVAGDGTGVLHVATVRGHAELVELLLARGADPNAAGPGYTALQWACGIWETIFTHDYQVETGEWSVLGGLSPSVRERIVAALLAGGADVNARATKAPPRFGYSLSKPRFVVGGTAFYFAAMAGEVTTMRRLLAAGADPAVGTTDGITPLMAAAGRARMDSESRVPEAQHLETVRLLLDMGANVAAADSVGDTPLHAAAYAGLNSVVQLLVDRGAPLNAVNKSGETPARVAEGFIVDMMLYARSSTAALLRALGGTTR